MSRKKARVSPPICASIVGRMQVVGHAVILSEGLIGLYVQCEMKRLASH